MIQIREFNLRDEEGIRELFYDCFGREMSHEEWVWKYMNSPWGSAAAITLDGNRVIAHYGGIKMKFYFKGLEFDVFQPCDVMTHPSYRARLFTKKGAMVKAAELFYNNNAMDFAFGFPSERHAILGTKILGYTRHGFINEITKDIVKKKFPSKLFWKIKIGWDYINPDEIDKLWEENKMFLNLSIQKDSNYIFWRYKNNPVKKYLPITLRSFLNKRLKVFVISYLKDDEFLILDYFFDRNFEKKELVLFFEKLSIDFGIFKIRLWVHPNDPFYNVFIKNGFSSLQSVPYIFKIISPKITDSFLFNNYFYRMGDYDAS